MINKIKIKITPQEREFCNKITNNVLSGRNGDEAFDFNKYLYCNAKMFLVDITEDEFVKRKMKPDLFKKRVPEPSMTVERAKQIFQEQVNTYMNFIKKYEKKD